MAKLESVGPMSDEDIHALPVRALGPAIEYYEGVLGFGVVASDATTAELLRDGATIGLVVMSDHKPAQAGSLAFRVDDLDELHRELSARGAKPGQFGVGEWGGKQHRTFFVREDEDGYCYCFFTPDSSQPRSF